MPTHAHPSAAAKRKVQNVVHPLDSIVEVLLAFIHPLHPAVRVELVGVLAEDLVVAVRDRGVVSDLRAAGEIPAVREGVTSGGDDALEQHCDTRVDAHGFV